MSNQTMKESFILNYYILYYTCNAEIARQDDFPYHLSISEQLLTAVSVPNSISARIFLQMLPLLLGLLFDI